MAQGTFEGGVVSIRGDASQVKEELSEVSKLLTELEKNKIKLKPEFDSKNIEKQVNQLGKYMEGKFGTLDFSKVYSNLMRQVQIDPNVFAKSLERAMHGFNLLDQAVKPEDINKLAAASAEEIFELVRGLGGLADTTKATGTPVTKRLQALYDKYPNGIEGIGGSGRGNGFGASEETLNKISDTLERIDGNVKNINDSIKTGAITVQAAADGAENVADKTKEAADAQAKLTEETKKTAKAEEQLGQAQEKNNKKKKDNSDKKTEEKKIEGKSPAQPPVSPSAPSKKKDEKVTINKPKPVVPEVDTKSLEGAIKKEEDLKTATEGAVQALEKQKGETQGGSDTSVNHATAEIDAQQTMLNAFLDSAKKAGAITQELGQKQEELAKVFQNTTDQIEEQNKVLNESQQTTQQSMFNAFANNAQKSGEALQQLGQQQGKLLSEAFQKNFVKSTEQSSARELSFKDITSYIGVPENIKDYIFDADSAQSFLKKIKKSGVWKGQEKKIWAAFQSIRGLIGNEEIDDILDQFTDLDEDFGYADLVFNSPDQGSKMERALEQYYDKYNRYKELLEKGDIEELDLDSLRNFHQTNMKYKMDAMSPSQTEQGYAQALDQMQKTLAVMEQYKKVLDQAMAEGREINKYDQEFLLNYERNHEQIERIADRAQTGVNRFQEARRLEAQKIAEKKREKEEEARQRAEEARQRAEEEKKYRKNFIEKDNKLDKEINEDNMSNDLSVLDAQIKQIQDNFGRTKDFKKSLEEIKKQDKDFAGGDNSALETYEDEWLEQYENKYKKRLSLIQKLKDKKKKLEAQQKEADDSKDSGQQSSNENVDQTQKNVNMAQKNADAAQEAADKAQKAADESEDAVKRANDAQKKVGENSSPQKDELGSSVAISENANQKAQKNVKYVQESKKSLEANLSQLQKQMDELQEKKEQLERKKEQFTNNKKYSDDFFELEAQDSGKTVKQYRKNKAKETTDELKKIETDLKRKQAELKQTQDKINHITELEQQGFDVQVQNVQNENKGKKKSKKPKIIMPNQGQAKSAVDGQIIETQVDKEKKDGEAAQQLGDQTKQTNDKLHEVKGLTEEQNQLLETIFTEGASEGNNQNGDGKGLQIENSAIANLIETLKEIPAVTQILTDFDAANSNIANNAKNVAEAIQAEADAFSSMTQASQGINDSQLITSDKKSGGVSGNTKNELKEIEQKKDRYKQITDQIKAIEYGRAQAEEEIARHNTSDKNFKVGRSKNKAYDLIKTYAEQLKQDYEAYEKLDPNDTSEKAKEIIAKYETSRVAFEKAFSKMMSPGIPKDKAEEEVGFWELQKKHGDGSEGYNEAEKNVADNLKFLEERLNQQKQQAEVVLQNLYAERDRLQQELTSTPSQTNTSLNVNNPPTDKLDLGGGQSANGIRIEGDEAGNAVANMQALAKAKQEVTEANQKLSQSAQETTNSLNGEAGAGANASEAFDPKPLQDQINAQKKAIDEQKKALEQQKSTITELKKANEDLAKAQAQASKEKMDNLRKENETFKKAQQTELEQRRQAELNAQVAANLQKKQFEEDERIRKEQEAKAAKKAEEKAKEAEENARIKAEDKNFSKIYTEYGKDYSSILDAKSIQEFDAAVAHLTETERLFWEARMLQVGGTSSSHNADVLKQNDLPEGYEKSVDTQTAVLKQREMAIAEYTASVIAELEKQEAAFEKMDTVYKTATDKPNHARKEFIDNSLIDRNQTQKYTNAIDDVTKSLQRMREIVQSMKDGTFDFRNIDALRELLELRQNLPNQMTTAKDADKAYKKAQGDIEADSIKKAEQYKTVLTGLEKQIETIQKNSRKLINPDDNYKVDLEAAKDLLATIQVMIEELNANPLQFMGKQGDKNAKNMQSIIDTFKDSTDGLQEDFLSQKGVQGRINTYLTSYKGAYTSFFREIKDSFKSEALGELQSEIDKTFVTFENSITDLNRATGLKQGEFLTQYLNANGGKASASQIEQQQKVRNAIAESYRGLITDISNELTKVQDRMGKVLGEDFLKADYFQKFGERFTAGLGSAKDFNAFQDSAQKARDSFSELQKIQKEMADGKLDLTSLAPDELKKRIEEIVGLFATLNENYQKVNKNAKEFTFADPGDIEKQRASIAQFLKSNQGISVDAQNSLRDYFNQLQQGISQADLTKLTDGWHQVADAEQAAGRTGTTFMSELQTRFKSLSVYLLSFVSFYRVIGVFKDGINIIHELDDALTEMQKVSDESLSSLREYQKSTFDTADKIGTTAAQLQQSTADWMRLGEDLQTASQSAQTANVLFNVSEFDNINDATTALVAMSAAYADAEKGIDKMDIVDRLNLIGNNYAIATDELATALQDGAATLQTAGNDLDQAIALTTAGNIKIA